jgi:hypothetical protein
MDWNSVVLVLVVAVVVFLTVRYWYLKKTLLIRIDNLERDARILRDRPAQSLWAAVQATVVPELIHAHAPVMDALLLKLGPPFSLTISEEQELDQLLYERIIAVNDPLISDRERASARILRDIIPRVREEIDMPPEVAVLQVVTIPKPKEDAEKN